MLDADLKRFQSGLDQTGPGMRLRLSMHESRIAVKQIARYHTVNDPRAGKIIESWRRAYIKACDNAAKAIDMLWEEHQWPEGAARDRSFEWRPTANFRP
jgi:hypothetical protein